MNITHSENFHYHDNVTILIIGGVLYYTNGAKPITQAHDALNALRECHDSPEFGHPGIQATRRNVQLLYKWPGMTDDIEEYVSY